MARKDHTLEKIRDKITLRNDVVSEAEKWSTRCLPALWMLVMVEWKGATAQERIGGLYHL